MEERSKVMITQSVVTSMFHPEGQPGQVSTLAPAESRTHPQQPRRAPPARLPRNSVTLTPPEERPTLQRRAALSHITLTPPEPDGERCLQHTGTGITPVALRSTGGLRQRLDAPAGGALSQADSAIPPLSNQLQQSQRALVLLRHGTGKDGGDMLHVAPLRMLVRTCWKRSLSRRQDPLTLKGSGDLHCV